MQIAARRVRDLDGASGHQVPAQHIGQVHSRLGGGGGRQGLAAAGDQRAPVLLRVPLAVLSRPSLRVVGQPHRPPQGLPGTRAARHLPRPVHSQPVRAQVTLAADGPQGPEGATRYRRTSGKSVHVCLFVFELVLLLKHAKTPSFKLLNIDNHIGG